jgi:hypothetical protein
MKRIATIILALAALSTATPALAGWYGMVPLNGPSRPLSSWTNMGAWDSAA